MIDFSYRLALSSWTCTVIWYQCMMWSPWKRSLMPIWTSTCGMKLIRDASSRPGSNLLTLNHHHCLSTNGAKVRQNFCGGKEIVTLDKSYNPRSILINLSLNILRHQQLAGCVGDWWGRMQCDAGVSLWKDVWEDRPDPTQQTASSYCWP